MRAFVPLLVLVGCSGTHAKEAPASTTLKLVDKGGRTLVELVHNDAIIDGRGTVVARVDWQTPRLIVRDSSEVLSFEHEPTGITVSSPLGALHATVNDVSELRVNGAVVGVLGGFSPSRDGWRRLAALVLVLPIVPEQVPPDAAVEARPPQPPPPPPPPPPPKRSDDPSTDRR